MDKVNKVSDTTHDVNEMCVIIDIDNSLDIALSYEILREMP